jgi:hypothetical protein
MKAIVFQAGPKMRTPASTVHETRAFAGVG